MVAITFNFPLEDADEAELELELELVPQPASSVTAIITERNAGII
jgi:hypothetical protein